MGSSLKSILGIGLGVCLGQRGSNIIVVSNHVCRGHQAHRMSPSQEQKRPSHIYIYIYIYGSPPPHGAYILGVRNVCLAEAKRSLVFGWFISPRPNKVIVDFAMHTIYDAMQSFSLSQSNLERMRSPQKAVAPSAALAPLQPSSKNQSTGRSRARPPSCTTRLHEMARASLYMDHRRLP